MRYTFSFTQHFQLFLRHLYSFPRYLTYQFIDFLYKGCLLQVLAI